KAIAVAFCAYHPSVSAFHFALLGSQLSLYTHLFTIWQRSHSEIRSVEGRIFSNSSYFAMPSSGRTWTRSRSIIFMTENTYILQIETATPVCSVALAKNGKTIAAVEADGPNLHASNITLFIDEVLQNAA